MKIFYWMLIGLAVSSYGCGGKTQAPPSSDTKESQAKTTKTTDDGPPVQLETVDLGDYSEKKLPLLMDVPVGADKHEALPGEAEILAGRSYQLFIKADQLNLADIKKKHQDPGASHKLHSIAVDEPQRLVVLVDMYGDEAYMIYANVDIDGKQYRVTNQRGGRYPSTKSQLDVALKSIGSLRLKDATAKPSEGSKKPDEKSK